MQFKKALKLHNLRNPNSKITQVGLGQILWEGSTQNVARTNAFKLFNGYTKSLKFEMLLKICDTLGCDMNFLFGIDSGHDEEFNQLNK